MKTMPLILLLVFTIASPRVVVADTIYVAEEQQSRITTVNGHGTQLFANGVGLVYSLAADSSGNIYAGDGGADIIRKVTPAGVVSDYASIPGPEALAFDGANLYVAMAYGIDRISPLGVVTRLSDFVPGVGWGGGLAFDAHGNLYASGGNSVFKITPGGVVSTFATGFNSASGVAFDQAGSLYVANYLGDTIDKVTSDGTVSLFATGLDRPTGLAFDSSGNLFAANITESQPLGYLSEITATGQVSQSATGLDYPTALVITPEPSVLCLSECGLLMVLMPRRASRQCRKAAQTSESALSQVS